MIKNDRGVPSVSLTFREGMRQIALEHDVQEAVKIHTLRAGNAGISLLDGQFAGSCPRLTAARYHGLKSEEISPGKQVMFLGGEQAESVVMRGLRSSAAIVGEFSTQEECAVAWATEAGTTVSGRPDILVDEVAIEVKAVSSLRTAADARASGSPKLEHLIQAGHYSRLLARKSGLPEVPGYPYRLFYIQFGNYATTNFVQAELEPRAIPDLTELDRRGKVKSVVSGFSSYEIQWLPGSPSRLRYRPEDGTDDQWILTPVTWEGIVAFYSEVERIATDEMASLPVRPLNLTGIGEEVGWNRCGYCPLSGQCDRNEGSPTKWWASVRRLSDRLRDVARGAVRGEEGAK